MNSLETIIAYHERSKHHPQRYARGPHGLDWATQPEPFRTFSGCEIVQLECSDEDDSPLYEDIYTPGCVAHVEISHAGISRFFYCSLAISAWKQAGDARWALRCNPSSGNLHPTEGYVALPAVGGIGDRPSVYHYCPRRHALERRTAFDERVWKRLTAEMPGGSFLIGLSSIHWREAWKYGERAYRYCQHDVGHALAALRIAAATLGWRLTALDLPADEDVARMLGLDRDADFGDAERETAALIAAVYPAHAASGANPSIDCDAIANVAAGDWRGLANSLSPRHENEWEIIENASAAARKPRGHIPAQHARELGAARRSVGETDRDSRTEADGDSGAAPARQGHGPTAEHLIRGRRSAVAFDGRTGISLEAFGRMMRRVLPERPEGTPPFDAMPNAARVHLFIFVHLVDDLSPGIYALVRTPAVFDRLRSATNPDFEWLRPAEVAADLPLYLLTTADCRRAAEQLSLGQAIAGTSAFSLGMVADFDDALNVHGAWYYRRLFWEAGMIGQVLYLEAEAAGLRATGIGAYFDDWVHSVLGLADRRFQSLYHFTVGGPVDDTRLTTLPAYPVPD